VTKGLWWKHIAAVQSIIEERFMKQSRKTFLKRAVPGFALNYF